MKFTDKHVKNSLCAFACALHVLREEANVISNRKEGENKPLFDVFATYDIKNCTGGFYFAIFDIIMSLMMLKCQKLNHYHSSSFVLPFSSFLLSGRLIEND